MCVYPRRYSAPAITRRDTIRYDTIRRCWFVQWGSQLGGGRVDAVRCLCGTVPKEVVGSEGQDMHMRASCVCHEIFGVSSINVVRVGWWVGWLVCYVWRFLCVLHVL
jgi:hypothetical protein